MSARPDMPPIRVGVLGMGTVGSGVVEVLARNREEIQRRAGRAIVVTRASVRDLDKARRTLAQAGIDSVQLTTDSGSIVRDPAIDIVVEVIGGTGIARELVLQAIGHGKPVVTANKALLALHGSELFDAAGASGVMIAFEAAVAGGIPIIKALREGLTANRIEWLAGIVNGTTNHILSEMRDKGLSFEAALADAQRLGYAEADPTFDVEGIDAAHKATILASIAFGIPVRFDRAVVEGITTLTADDFRWAERFGYRIKLLAIARRRPHGIELRVHPTLIPQRRLLASVDGAMNAIWVQADTVGATMYYGKGAGKEPTASAVIADLVDVARTMTVDPGNRVPHLAFQPDAVADLPMLPAGDIESRYYLRMAVADEPGVLADVARHLADAKVSIDAMVQADNADDESSADIVLLTHQSIEHRVDAAIRAIEALPTVRSSVVRLRVEQLA